MKHVLDFHWIGLTFHSAFVELGPRQLKSIVTFAIGRSLYHEAATITCYRCRLSAAHH